MLFPLNPKLLVLSYSLLTAPVVVELYNYYLVIIVVLWQRILRCKVC